MTPEPEKLPVVLEIEFHGSKGLFEMSADYTSYPGEDEVLIQDGLQYNVISKSEETMDDGRTYTKICLQYKKANDKIDLRKNVTPTPEDKDQNEYA